MQQWEYLTVIIDRGGKYLVSGTGLRKDGPEWRPINDLGRAGWELVSADWIASLAVFKRRIGG